MNENFTERKIELLLQLKEKYAEKPRSWWQSKKITYTTTWDAGNATKNYQRNLTGINIRNNLNEAIVTIAFLFVFIVFSVVAFSFDKAAFFFQSFVPRFSYRCTYLCNNKGNRQKVKIDHR